MPEPIPRAARGAGAERVADWIAEHVAAGHWPGAVAAFGPVGDEPEWIARAGWRTREPDRGPLAWDTLYDLASLTKPLATAASALALAARGAVDLDRPLEDVLGAAQAPVPSYAELLLHTAGLPAWLPLPRLCRGRDDVVEAIAAYVAKHGGPARGAPLYGCLGPILAGVALERQTGRALAEIFRDEVAAPAAIDRREIVFAPLGAGDVERAAPTETEREVERKLIADLVASGRLDPPAPAAPARGPAPGRPDDGNADHLGGAAGNAGLFGTARGVFRLASAIATGSAWGGPHATQRAFTVAARSAADARTFGFQAGSAPSAPRGPLASSSAGHVGFTGTSVWIDRERDFVAVLLSNRVHPHWREAPVNSWRARFHELAWSIASVRGARA